MLLSYLLSSLEERRCTCQSRDDDTSRLSSLLGTMAYVRMRREIVWKVLSSVCEFRHGQSRRRIHKWRRRSEWIRRRMIQTAYRPPVTYPSKHKSILFFLFQIHAERGAGYSWGTGIANQTKLDSRGIASAF